MGERIAVIVATAMAAADAPGGRGSGREEWSGGKVRGKETVGGSKLDGQHVYFLFQPSLGFGEKNTKK